MKNHERSELFMERMRLFEHLLSSMRADHRCGVVDYGVICAMQESLKQRIAKIDKELKDNET